MSIAIKLNTAERIRRALEANPGMSEADLAADQGVTISQVKAALAFRRQGQKRGQQSSQRKKTPAHMGALRRG